jgi:hypothetical protein
MTIEEIVDSFRTKIVDETVFFRPDIPKRKLVGAINGYAQGVAEDDVLVLVDNTVFGGAGDGLLVSRDLFAAHDIMEPPVRVPIAEVRDVRLDSGVFAGNRIYLNGDRLLATLNLTGKAAIPPLVDMLRAIASGAAADEPPGREPPRQPMATHCKSCGAPLPTSGPACIYCGTGIS